MRKSTTGNVKSGAAGHVGHDRQPEKGATKGEVKRRSEGAAALKEPKHARKDMVHPGPEREEGEKSKGDANHDQHEREKEMKAEEL